MAKRAVVNVATGTYFKGQERLRESLVEHDPNSMNDLWWKIPDDWPKHEDKPYAFKAYVLRETAKTAEIVLWCDASVVAVRSLEPLWEKIERDGYWMSRNGWSNYQWTADSAYADLFPGVDIERARVVNREIPHVVATAFGLDLRSPIGTSFLSEYFRLAQTNAFCGPWSNANNPERRQNGGASPCGPPDVLGHRHDQTAASVIAWRLGMELTDPPEFFAYPPGDERTVLLAVGI